MAANDGRPATYSMNRLAGTLAYPLDFDGAAIVWADNVIPGHKSSRGIDALNKIWAYRNGGKNYAWDTPGVLSMLAVGYIGLGENEAARRILS